LEAVSPGKYTKHHEKIKRSRSPKFGKNERDRSKRRQKRERFQKKKLSITPELLKHVHPNLIPKDHQSTQLTGFLLSVTTVHTIVKKLVLGTLHHEGHPLNKNTCFHLVWDSAQGDCDVNRYLREGASTVHWGELGSLSYAFNPDNPIHGYASINLGNKIFFTVEFGTRDILSRHHQDDLF